MNKHDKGYILVDTIVVLLILSLTLTSVYGLVIRSMNMETKIIKRVEILLDQSETYDEAIKNIL